MRIVCPNCASQYEVDDSAIPETGRDVQCAKCSEVWFQDPPMLLTPIEQPLSLDTPAPQEQDSQPQVVAPEPQSETPVSEPEAPTQQTQQSSPEPEMPRGEPTVSEVYEDLQRQQKYAETGIVPPASQPTPEPVSGGMELPEVIDQPDQSEMETTNGDAAPAAPAMFRSLRANRAPSEAPQSKAPSVPPVEPTPEPTITRPNLSADVKNILQEEADYSSQMRETGFDQSPPQEPEPSPTVDHVEPAPMIEEPAIDYAEPTPTVTPPVQPIPSTFESTPEPSELIQQVRNIEASESTSPDTPTSQPDEVTLASAKSLRDVLASQAAGDAASDEVKQDFVQDANQTSERSLSDLGFKRPDTPAEINPLLSDAAPSFTGTSPQLDPHPQLAATSAKSGKAVFTDIDEINSTIEMDSDTDSKLDRPEPMEELSGGESNAFKTGFYGACAISLITLAMYVWGPILADSVPAADGFVTSFRDNIDSGRMVLQNMYYGGEGEPGFDNLMNNLKAKL